ncbi:MAG: tripartite tricarboxylate transporter substrate binding protein [Betaproteobacteria bacterium]|nr:tripartite tricarboxylate transporter substrate binding protein [Betaproteobacteria bacterium]
MRHSAVVLTALLLLDQGAALSQPAWKPEKNVEIIVGSAPGGSNDKTARTVERIITQHRLINGTLTVVNKPGGGGTIALTYLNQHPGDGHFVIIGTPSLLTNHITGSSKLHYSDFTPVASLFNDYIVFAVNAASPVKTGKDLIERLKQDPKSLTIGFATALGSHNHIAAGLLMKGIGGDVRNLKAVAFKGSADAITALLGAHIDLVTTAAGNAGMHVASGRMRLVGVAAPRRFSGTLAAVPTWKEQGVDVVFGGWRSVMGAKGMTAAQVAYWEGVLRRISETPEWKADLEKNFWADDFATSAQFRKDLEREYAAMKAVLAELGLAKQ